MRSESRSADPDEASDEERNGSDDHADDVTKQIEHRVLRL